MACKKALVESLRYIYLSRIIEDFEELLDGMLGIPDIAKNIQPSVPLCDEGIDDKSDGDTSDDIRKVELDSTPDCALGNLDQVHDIWLTPQEATEGTMRTIKVEDKKYDVYVPRNTKMGGMLRLKGLGAINTLTLERGDLYLRVNISLFTGL